MTIEVSVIIPTYNSAHYLPTTIDSVLAQTVKNIEILVVDDGSTDNTAEVLNGYDGARVRYLPKQNGGVSTARNHGIENAAGKYVAFLDADDIWHPQKLEKQLKALGDRPDCQASYTSLRKVTDDLEPLGVIEVQRNDSLIEDLLLVGNVVGSPSSIICLRRLFEKTGGFDPLLSQCADWDMWIRLAIETDFAQVREPLVDYRIHASNMSKNAALLEKDSVLLMEKTFALPNLPASVKDKKSQALAKHYMVLAGTYFQSGLYADFIRCARVSVGLDFKQINYLVQFPLRLLKNRTQK
jgi:glycosyltransferase involved in cell wall biosynthesis